MQYCLGAIVVIELAHNRDVTSHMDDDNGSIVYDFVGLKKFAEKMRTFFDVYEKLKEKLTV
jgi:hypothetical protein